MLKPGARVNTTDRYGTVSKTFHWLTALLVFTAIALGLAANNWSASSLEAIQTKFMLFSFHKTAGVLVFFVSLVRMLWAISQPKPTLLNASDRLESWFAESVHWALYISLVMVPMSGWLHHAAADGFAPIWWPFGQGLPFVPKNAELAALFSSMHWVFTKVLVLAILLHVAGALKHHLIDRDNTLRRMLPGQVSQSIPPTKRSHAPIVTAISLYALAMIAGAVLWNMQRTQDADVNAAALFLHQMPPDLAIATLVTQT